MCGTAIDRHGLLGTGETMAPRELFGKLIDTWRASERPGPNTLLPAVLPMLLPAPDAAAQAVVLEAVHDLVVKKVRTFACTIRNFC